MSVYVTTGGSGNSTSYGGAANSSASIALFTTPNVPNTMFLITIHGEQDEAITEWTYNASQYAGTSAPIALVEQSRVTYQIKAGPNTAVKVARANQSSTTSTGNVSYNYCGIIIDTN